MTVTAGRNEEATGMGDDRGKGMSPKYCGALTRRGLLKSAGWTIAASALLPVVERGKRFGTILAAESGSPVMAKLSAYMSEAGNRALPDEVIEKAKHHVLDTFAAMVSGSELPPGRAAIQFARSYGGEKKAPAVGSDVFFGPIGEAPAKRVVLPLD